MRGTWLVMGSGGQTSTLDDIARWLNALHAYKIVEPQDLARIVGRRGQAFGVGGDMFGFEIHYSMAPGNFMILMSNAMDSPEKPRYLRAMSQQLRALFPEHQNRYSLGIALDAADTGIVISRVVAGSAAERDGLQEGDVLLAIAGRSTREHDPIEVLEELLSKADPIDFKIERDGKRHTVQVTPLPRQ